MAIQAQLADGRTLEFPDGTDPAVIQSTVKRMIGVQDVRSTDVGATAASPDLSTADRVIGGLEAAGSIVSGAVAEPLAGIAGTLQAINPFADEGAGAQAVQATREALTFQPRTQGGQQAIQAVGEALAPVGEAVQGAEQFLGEATLEATGSPALATAAATAPTALLELIGFKGVGKLAKGTKRVAPSNRAIDAAIKKSSPNAETIKSASRALYSELDSSGVTMKPRVFEGMVNKITKSTTTAGLDPRTTPNAAGALEAMRDVVGTSPSLTEIDTLRKIAQAAAKNIDPTEKALGVQIISGIDDFLDSVSPKGLNKGAVSAAEVGSKYRAARQLWGRAAKSEKIQDIFETAQTQASGVENGIRIGIDKILRSKKQSKFFSEAEKAALRDVSSGNAAQNFSKLIGRFGFSEGRATNIIGGAVGVGGGLAAGSVEGAIAAATIGQTARKISQVLTKNRAQFVDSIVRAGPNGREIAKTYLSAVPVKKRSVSELADLLSDPNVDISNLATSANNITREAAKIAEGRKSLGSLFGTLAAGQTQQEAQ